MPLEIRHRLGLKEGDRVEFAVENNQTILRPARAASNPFEKYVGCLPAFETKQEIKKWIADLRGGDRG